MRVVKDAEERRGEILDVAERLFAEKGFDATSTSDILSAIGIARGTLYYHFKSKEDILDAVIGRMTSRMVGEASRIASERDVPVLGRITQTMLSLRIDSELGYAILEEAHKPQNALMHQKMQQRILAEVSPIIAGLIEEGVEQGICHTDYPLEVAEMTLLYSSVVSDDMSVFDEKERKQKVAAFICNVERLLGMRPGSMAASILPLFTRPVRN